MARCWLDYSCCEDVLGVYEGGGMYKWWREPRVFLSFKSWGLEKA